MEADVENQIGTVKRRSVERTERKSAREKGQAPHRPPFHPLYHCTHIEVVRKKEEDSWSEIGSVSEKWSVSEVTIVVFLPLHLVHMSPLAVAAVVTVRKRMRARVRRREGSLVAVDAIC